MKIVASKSNAFNIKQFIEKNKQREYVEGLFLNIAGTIDNRIIIFDFGNSNYTDLTNIENQTLNTIKATSIISLTEFLDLLVKENITQKIYLNILLNFNIIEYNKIRDYISVVINILDKYPMFSFYLSSQNQNVVSNLKNFDSNYPIGYIVGPGSYIDVDFYIFTVLFLNSDILNEQFKKDKSLMILLTSWTDLQYIMNFLNNPPDSSSLSNNLKEELRIIGDYPEIIHNSLI